MGNEAQFVRRIHLELGIFGNVPARGDLVAHQAICDPDPRQPRLDARSFLLLIDVTIMALVLGRFEVPHEPKRGEGNYREDDGRVIRS